MIILIFWNELSKNFTIFELQEFNSLASSYSKKYVSLIETI